MGDLWRIKITSSPRSVKPWISIVGLSITLVLFLVVAGTSAPSDPTLDLTDQTSASTTHTDSTTVYAAIGNDVTAVAWILSETQVAPPQSTSASWIPSRPTTYSFDSGTNETKTVYVWVKDAAGDVNTGPVSDSIILDTKNPTATVGVGTALIYDGDLIQEVTVTYDEAMAATPTPNIAFNTTAGIWSSTVAGAWDGTAKIWTESFTITDVNEEVAGVDVVVTVAKDVAGNTQVAKTESAAFSVDTKNPTATVGVGTALIYDGDLIQEVTVTYDEAMAATPTPNIAFNTTAGIWSSTVAGAWDGTAKIWTESFTITDVNEEVAGVDVVVTVAKDVAGNTQVAKTESAAFSVDTKNPTITSITSTTANGCYTVGATINVTVNFSEQVTLAGGNLTVNLDSGGSLTITPFTATTSSETYTVAAGHNSCDLNVTSFALNGATLRDNAGNDADFTLPAGNNLADNKAIVVDTTLPVAVDDPNGNEDRSSSDDIEVRVDDYAQYRLMVREDTSVWINVLFNDTDLPCTVLLRIHDIPQQPKFGTATFDNPAGNIRYTPDRGYRGPDHFTYRIRDACGNISPVGTVYVEVICQMVMDDVYITACTDTPTEFDVTATDLWIDPDDPDLISFTFDIVSAPAHGVVSGDLIDITYTLPGRTTKQMESASISLTYTPATGFTGRDIITVRFADPFGGFSTAVVDIVVTDCVEPVEEIAPILLAQGDVLPMIVPLSFASIYEAAWDTVTLVALVDGSTYAGALSASWDERMGRFILTLDSELLPPGMYLLTIPLGNGETVSLAIEIGVAG